MHHLTGGSMTHDCITDLTTTSFINNVQTEICWSEPEKNMHIMQLL